QRETLRRELEDSPFGHDQHSPPRGESLATAEGDLLDALHELPDGAFALDHQLTGPCADLQALGSEGAAEDYGARAPRDVHETAGTHDTVAEATDVDVAVAVDFGEAQHGQIEPPSVVEVEETGGVYEGAGVPHQAEVGSPGGDASRRTLLDAEGHATVSPRCGGYSCYTVGDSEA